MIFGPHLPRPLMAETVETPTVRRQGGHYEFLIEGRVVYDFTPTSPGDALRWIQHLAGKAWVTKRHLREFARLVADQHGVRYR